VASTDLSHYPSAANASMVDRQTLQAILRLILRVSTPSPTPHRIEISAAFPLGPAARRPSWRPWLPPGTSEPRAASW